MSRPLRFLFVLTCACLLEIGWVASVRLVHLQSVWAVAMVAMVMQTIAYGSILLVVDDRRLAVAGIIGAGVGAVVGMLLPLSLS